MYGNGLWDWSHVHVDREMLSGACSYRNAPYVFMQKLLLSVLEIGSRAVRD
jgi:hypothetical protein